MFGYDAGDETKVEIRSSTETRKEFKRMCAQIDPDLTQEEVMHVILATYQENPLAFEDRV